MSKSTYAATFFLIWWVVLFAVLPWGVRSQLESGDSKVRLRVPSRPGVTG
jgi:predicted secreted protein